MNFHCEMENALRNFFFAIRPQGGYPDSRTAGLAFAYLRFLLIFYIQ
jgi:hypothetical protein